MRSHRQSMLRGVAALIGLLGALVGVPLGLMALGQGRPTRLPPWHQVVNGVQRPITDSALIRAAGVVCWVLWAAFVVAVVAEVIAELEARRSAHRSKPRRLQVPGLQRVAHALVLTAVLLVPQRGLAGVAAATASPAAMPVALHHHSPRQPEAGRARLQTSGGPTADDEDAGSDAAERPSRPAAAGPAPVAAAGNVARSAVIHSRSVPSPPHPSGQLRYVVQRYDSPWSIAERHLGDGTRWRDIVGADGRRLIDPPTSEGSRSKRTTARILHPGEVLLLPVGQPRATDDGSGTHPISNPVADRSAGRPAAPARPPDPPSGASTAARASPPAPPRWTSSPSPAAPADAAGPMSRTSSPAPDNQAEPATAAGTAPTLSAPTLMEVARHQRSTNTAAGLVEAGLVGAAVLAVVGARRQRQAQRRPNGRRIRLPGRELARCEQTLRATQTPDRAILVSRGTEFLAETLARTGVAPPTVLGVVVDDDGLEVLLDRPARPPAPWTPSAEGFRWRIAAGDINPSPTHRSAPLPALASVGRAAAGSADVLINLEAAGMVGIAGQPARAAGLLDAMATHLAGAPWAGAVDLVLVGLAPTLSVLDRVRTSPSIAGLRDELRATASVMTETMAGHRCADPFQGRVAGVAGDGWPPVLVLCAERPGADDLAWLSEVARPGTGVAAVVAAPADVARWAIDVDLRPMPVDPLRLGVEPIVLAADDVAHIGALVEIADDDAGADLSQPPYDRIDLSVESACPLAVLDQGPIAAAAPDGLNHPAEPDSHDEGTRPDQPTSTQPTLTERLTRVNPPPRRGPGSDRDGPVPSLPDAAIVVRVLGSVEVDGAREFRRAKARELVVYLAMHPNGVGEAELDEALWPSSTGRVVSPATRDSTVSAARTAIGGLARLLPAQGQGREKRYQLDRAVQSDWSRFCLLHRWGRDHRSIAALGQALELVRGRPFEGVVSGRTYGWIHMEGHARHIEAEMADAADLAAGLCLDGGDALGARWAARRGLLADPYTERLWVRLMEAAHHLGESQEVERIMDEMDVVLELGGDFSGLHPMTLAAYDRFSRRHRFPA